MITLINNFSWYVGIVVWVVVLQNVRASFSTTAIGPKPMWNATHTDKLRQDLLHNYDKFSRPTQHFNSTIVSFGIVIRHIEVNEIKSTVTVHSWVQLQWMDEKLKWNSSDYGGLENLHIADHEIWQPDLFLYNSATATAINHYGNTHCIVNYGGSVLWVPPTQFTVLCEFNLRYWPFDTQHCALTFGSWTYNGYQIDLQFYNNRSDADKSLLFNSTEWQIRDTHAERNLKYYPCCEEPYPDISVHLTLERVSPSYKAIIIAPAFVIIAMTLAGFWLPPQAGEKIILNGITALIITLYLLHFNQKIPASSTHTPLIVFFFSSSLYVVCFSIIGSVVVIWMSRTKHTNSLPWGIKNLLVGRFGRYLGLGNYVVQSAANPHRVTAEEMRDHQVTDFDDSNEDHQIIGNKPKGPQQQDWVLFAAAIDRLSFALYALLFALLSIVYSL